MKLNFGKKLNYAVFFFLFTLSFFSLSNLSIVPSIPSMDLSPELLFKSPTIHDISDLNYLPSGEFYYSSQNNRYVFSYYPKDEFETNKFRLVNGFVYKFTVNPYSGDLYYVEEGNNTINVIQDYLYLHANFPGSNLPSSPILSHSSTIRDLAIDPTNQYLLLFSTIDGSIYYTYEDYNGDWQIGLYMNVPMGDVGGSWDGEFSFDNYGYLYINQGIEGNIYRYDTTKGEISLFYTSSSTTITSICFDNANIIHYTTGNDQVFRLASLTQTLTDYTNDAHSFEIAIIFVGYDEDIINISEITNELPYYGATYLGGDKMAHSVYKVNYSCYFANQTYKNALDDFVVDHSVSDTPTVQLDIPALEYQAEFWDPQDIFVPKNGTAIDGNAVETWLGRNRYITEADYSFYLLNFSYLDTELGNDHWFEIKDIDVDSGINKHWFRNEFDFPWNLDAKFPYPGYTGYKSSDVFLDPTAFQWYLKWREVWNALDIDDGDHEFYKEDLDHFLKSHDPTTSTGKNAINDYITDLLTELIPIHLFWEPVNMIDYSDTISVQVKIFNGVHDLGFSNSDLEWTVNQTSFAFAYSELMPESTINFDVEFLNLTDYFNIQGVLSSNLVDFSPEQDPIDNYTYYDGSEIFYTLFDSPYLEQFFDLDAANLVVTGFAFILDNATFASPGLWAGGGLFTGLGGNRRILQLMELDRLYYPNRSESIAIPRQGFSKVLIHETGHAIGFPHTFSSTQYVPDFTADTMGYYGGFSRFSRIRIEGFQRYAAEQEMFEASKIAQELMMNSSEAGLLVDLQRTWDDITDNYSTKNFVEARQIALELQQLLLEGSPDDSSSAPTSHLTTVPSSTISTTTSHQTTITSRTFYDTTSVISSSQGTNGYNMLLSFSILILAVIYKKNRRKM
jgi:hypothetical protein